MNRHFIIYILVSSIFISAFLSFLETSHHQNITHHHNCTAFLSFRDACPPSNNLIAWLEHHMLIFKKVTQVLISFEGAALILLALVLIILFFTKHVLETLQKEFLTTRKRIRFQEINFNLRKLLLWIRQCAKGDSFAFKLGA